MFMKLEGLTNVALADTGEGGEYFGWNDAGETCYCSGSMGNYVGWSGIQLICSRQAASKRCEQNEVACFVQTGPDFYSYCGSAQ